jgi:NADH-quinone oxidoreductase subunit H
MVVRGLIHSIVLSLILIIPIIISVAFFTLAERKIMAAIQRRRGPNVVGVWGILQPIADGLKLVTKEFIVPSKAKTFLFMCAPSLTFFLALIGWAVIPFGFGNVFADIYSGVLYIFAVSSLSIYGVILAGWASNSKYALLGGLRSAAQMISYEVSIGLILVPLIICSGSLNLTEIVFVQSVKGWFCFPLCPLTLVFCISVLAETNRAPFDLPEAEAELVAGFNVEYSSMGFALFFLGEYCSMILMSSLIVIFFFGGWLPLLPFLTFLPAEFWFSFKTTFFCFMFILVRANLPRFRYDQLMSVGWKAFLPFTLGYLVFFAGSCISFNLI